MCVRTILFCSYHSHLKAVRRNLVSASEMKAGDMNDPMNEVRKCWSVVSRWLQWVQTPVKPSYLSQQTNSVAGEVKSPHTLLPSIDQHLVSPT